ncbi:MAG: hypothetical protein J5656_01360 [Clostridia bacterium]|nr:hypothetical protein [Clostridia bacterium]
MTKNNSLRLYLLCILMILALVATALTITQLFNKGEGIANAGTYDNTIKVGSVVYTGSEYPITFDYNGDTHMSTSIVEANTKPVQSNYEYYYLASDLSTPIDNPVNAGDYVAKYKIATDASPNPDTEISIYFSIKKVTPNWVLQATGDDWLWQYAEDTTLAEKFHVVFGALPDGNDDVVAAAITWRYSTDGGSSWADAEMNIEKSYPGQYWVKATVATTTNYLEYTTAPLPFEISKARLYPVFEEQTYNARTDSQQLYAKLSSKKLFSADSGLSTINYAHVNSSYEYVGVDLSYGTNAGDYPARLYMSTASYTAPGSVSTGKKINDLFTLIDNGVECAEFNATWTISKANINVSVSVSNKTYGTAITEPVVISASGEGAYLNGWVSAETSSNKEAEIGRAVIVNKYALKGNTTSSTELADGDWTTTVPTNAGTYYVRSYISGLLNYNDTYNTTDATFTIDKKAFYFMAQDNTITYGETPVAYGYGYNGLVEGDDFNTAIDVSGLTYSFNYNQYDDVGEYTITLSGATSNNYNIIFTTGTLTVEKAPLTITAKYKSINYGDEPSNYGVNYSGFVGTDDESVLEGILQYSYNYQAGDNWNTSGLYKITVSGVTATNYDITFVQGDLYVQKRYLSIKYIDKYWCYGNSSLPNFYSVTILGITSLYSGDSIENAIEVLCDYDLTVYGEYPITINKINDNYNCTVYYYANPNAQTGVEYSNTWAGNRAKFYVTPRNVNISIKDRTNPSFAGYLKSEYGEAFNFTNGYNVSNGSYNGYSYNQGNPIIGDDNADGSVFTLKLYAEEACQNEVTLENLPQYGIGTYYIKAVSTNPNYRVAYRRGNEADNTPGYYEIQPKYISVVMADKNVQYGNSLDSLSYTIGKSGLAVNIFVYGDEEADLFDFYIADSLDNVIPNASLSTTVPGTYYIKINDKSSANYNINYSRIGVSGTPVYTISKRSITVYINDASSIYGETPATLTADDSAIVNNDDPADVYTLSCSVTSTTSYGGYDITGANVEGSKYIVTFRNAANTQGYARYNVNKRPIVITNVNTTIPNFDYLDSGSTINTKLGNPYDCLGVATTSTYGLTNGHVITDVILVSFNTKFDGTGTAVAYNGVSGSLDAGKYYLVVTGINNNYEVSSAFDEQTSYFEVLPREVDETCINYFPLDYYTGFEQEPYFEFRYNGNNITYTATGETAATNAGNYTMTLTANGNFKGSIKFTWTINKAGLDVIVEDLSVLYGTTNPQYTVTSNDFLGTDTVAVLDFTNAIFTTEYTDASPIGEYLVTVSGITSANYEIFDCYGGYITVTPRPISAENIVVTSSAFTYTGLSQSPTYEVKFGTRDITCNVSGDRSAIYPGEYTVTVKGTGNYSGKASFNWSIAKKAITYTWGDSEFTYDGQAHAPALTINGLVEADGITSTIMGSKTNAGSYTASVVLSGPALANYILPQDNTKAFSIAKATQTIDVSGIVTSKPYTGSVITFDGATASYAGSMITYDNNAYTNVGTYTMTIFASESTNYLQASRTLEVTITEAAPKTDESGASEYTKDIPVDETGNAKNADITSIIKSAAADNSSASLEIKVGDNESIVLDKNAITALASASNIKVSMETKKGDNASSVVAGAVVVFEITIDGATFENGKATVSAPFSEEIPAGKVAKVYFVDANGNKTDMNARFENGLVIFETNHFSTYAVVFEDAPKGGLSGGAIAGIVIAIVVVLGAVGFCVYWFVFRKKKDNKPAQEDKEEAKQDETTEESAEEEPQEEEEVAQEETVEEEKEESTDEDKE